MTSPTQNPFASPFFWGRQNEIRAVYKYLSSTSPQCCALIGENTFGKTSLLRHLANPQTAATVGEPGIENRFTFVYLDCISYIGSANLGDTASARFWWDLYSTSWAKLRGNSLSSLSEIKVNTSQPPLDRAFELKSLLEDLIREQSCPIIFLLDNFEGVARLPLRDSEWLRSLVQYPCAYVVASRHLLYLLYQYSDAENWASPSPLWNLFSDPIYLGLMAEDEVKEILSHAGQQVEQAGSSWEPEDSCFIRKIAGRHPELIRLACSRLFLQRLQSNQFLKMNEKEFLEFNIYKDARPICRLLWRGLADPELWQIPGRLTPRNREAASPLSPYQKALINLAHEQEVTDKKLLLVLEQRGLIEQAEGKWRIFAEVMRQFVLEQEGQMSADEHQRTINVASTGAMPQPVASPERRGTPFTHLEDKVYAYLRSHQGQVCDREEIKQAVWRQEQNIPTNSALQKIIERIREKIEPDPTNPHSLISVRGRGYLLRENS